jgi:hypothetical protein
MGPLSHSYYSYKAFWVSLLRQKFSQFVLVFYFSVLFEIELLNFVEQAGLDDYFSMTEVTFYTIEKIYNLV